MTYPPQGGFPDPNSPFGPQDPNSGWQDPGQGYRPQPDSAPPAAPSPQYGWPDQTPQQYSQPQQYPAQQYPPQYQQQPNYGPPQQPGYGPTGPGYPTFPSPPPQKSQVGLFIGLGGGVLAVLVAVVLVVVLTRGNGEPVAEGKSATPSESSQTSQGPDVPAVSPTAVVDAYYDAAHAHDVVGMMDTLCQAEVTSWENQGSPGASEYDWTDIDASVYVVTGESGADTDTATVTVDHTLNDRTSQITIELIVENQEWKICYWTGQ